MSKCKSCGEKSQKSRAFPSAVVEINNPEQLVLLRKVVIPASMPEETNPPVIGRYKNVILQYEDTNHLYIYSSDGIPTPIEANIPQEILDRIDQLEIDVDVLETGLANETEAREAADSALSSSIESLSSSLSAETEAREQADAALEGSINNLTADLEEEATARETADTALGSRIDTVADNLATETANRISADEDLQADITAEATARQNADTTLQNNITAEATARANGDAALNTAITSETTARQEADTNLQNQITQETQARAAADTAINEAITAEATTRQTADAGLQNQIDAITASSDVKDIVGTKAELNNYDTSTLGDNDIIKVLQDESENNATTYYRWNATTQQFTLIGEEGPYYTKSQADTLLNAKQNTLTAGSNVQIVNDTISATDTTYTAGTGLALNGTQFSVDTTAIATQSDLTAGLATKQDTLTAGNNIQIANNTISATDTTYTAGNGLSLVGTEFSADTTVLATQTDLATKQDALTAGSNVQINNNVISATDTTYTAGTGLGLTGTEFSVDFNDVQGKLTAGQGISIADESGDLVISATSTGPNVVQTTGTSTTDVMSQNAVTNMICNQTDYPGEVNAIRIGNYATNNSYGGSIAIGLNSNVGTGQQQAIAIGPSTQARYSFAFACGVNAKAQASYAMAVGNGATASARGSVALGANASASTQGEFNIGASSAAYGYNSSNYRLLSGLYDGQSAHDAATYGQVISYSAINGAGAPTTATEGKYVGQLYYDTTNEAMYFLKTIDTTTTPATYTWEALGGSSVNVVQSPGTSRTDVMSQYAATKLVYPDYSSTVLKAIRIIGSTSSGAHSEEVTIGYGVSANAGRSAVGVGYQSNNNGERSVAIGNYARATGEGAIAIGEGSYASTRGEMNIGTTTSSMYSRSYGYNNSPYRLLTGLYDPQSDHDAATKGYVDNSLLGKQDALTAGSGISIADESGSLVISTTVAEPDEFTSNEWNALWS